MDRDPGLSTRYTDFAIDLDLDLVLNHRLRSLIDFVGQKLSSKPLLRGHRLGRFPPPSPAEYRILLPNLLLILDTLYLAGPGIAPS